MKNPLVFQTFQDRKGGWRWHIMRCGRILCDSGESYTRRSTMMRTVHGLIKSLQLGRFRFAGKFSKGGVWVV